jgi:hypothetical protein
VQVEVGEGAAHESWSKEVTFQRSWYDIMCLKLLHSLLACCFGGDH